MRAGIAIALLVLAVAAPVVEKYGAQQASRYSLTAAIWDHHTIELDRYSDADPPVLGKDRAVRDGHTYSDKAPLQPIYAVPGYAAYRIVGGEPATTLRVEQNLGVWSVKVWSVALPGAMLALLMWVAMRRQDRGFAVSSVVAVFFGTILLPLSSVLFGHVLSAVFLFASFVLASSDEASRRSIALAGLLASLAVVTEYTAVLGVITVGLFTWWRWRSHVLLYCVGGLPGLLVMTIYNTAAFGSPTTLSYQWTAYYEIQERASGLFTIFTGASWEKLGTLLFAGRGLAIATPIVIMAVAGLVVLALRGSRNERAIAVTSLATLALFAALSASWGNQWGGASPGPRYLTPALPFLSAGLPILWRQMRLLVTTAAVISISTMAIATMTTPLMAVDTPAGLGGWIKLAASGQFSPTVFSVVAGDIAGPVIHFLVIAAAAAVVVRSAQSTPALTPNGIQG